MQSTWVLALGSTSQAPSVSMLEGAVTLHVHDRTYLNALTLEPVLSGLGVVEVPDKQTALELKVLALFPPYISKLEKVGHFVLP